MSINKTKSKGLDDVPVEAVKVSINFILKPLLFIINMSLNKGKFPNVLKVSKVIPIHKKNDKTQL